MDNLTMLYKKKPTTDTYACNIVVKRMPDNMNDNYSKKLLHCVQII